MLVTLARDWAPVTVPDQNIKMWAAVTLRPHPGIEMRLAPAFAITFGDRFPAAETR